jgi:pyruvate/2-oxoglutarate dehydrogenase complex dihydrolipoamide acyltransferase (E2) component
MPVELKIPAIGESITEAQIGDWLKAAGDPVRQDEPLVVLETDKASLELPAPVSGVLARILKQKGETVRVGEVIAHLEAAAAPEAAPAPAAPLSLAKTHSASVNDGREAGERQKRLDRGEEAGQSGRWGLVGPTSETGGAWTVGWFLAWRTGGASSGCSPKVTMMQATDFGN